MKFLVDDARKWYKMATIQFWIFVGVMAQLAEIILPFSSNLSPAIANSITIMSVISITLRLYKQKNLDDNNIPTVRPDAD